MHDFWNQWPQVIFGREGEENVENNLGDEGEGSDDEGSSDDSGDEGQNQANDTGGKTAEDFEKLERALAAERRQNKLKERELKKLRAAHGSKEQEENEDLESTKNELQTARAKAEKLAAGLLKRDIDAAIAAEARELKFLDVEDALNGVDRSQIVYDQDDEDPTDIDIDVDSVKRVVKALATRKPHFLSRGTSDGEPTGSTFGGSRKRDQKPRTDTLRELYPSL